VLWTMHVEREPESDSEDGAGGYCGADGRDPELQNIGWRVSPKCDRLFQVVDPFWQIQAVTREKVPNNLSRLSIHEDLC
jgi:hypothetical protein